MDLVLSFMPRLIHGVDYNGVIVHATINERRRLQWLTYMDLVLSFMPRLIHGADYRTMLDINRREFYRL